MYVRAYKAKHFHYWVETWCRCLFTPWIFSSALRFKYCFICRQVAVCPQFNEGEYIFSAPHSVNYPSPTESRPSLNRFWDVDMVAQYVANVSFHLPIGMTYCGTGNNAELEPAINRKTSILVLKISNWINLIYLISGLFNDYFYKKKL